jgi:16S rRNA (cytosine967-C5)-methyltransferase
MGRFSESLLDNYVQTQRLIMDNLAQELVPGAFLLYLTCSAYRDENEDMTNYLKAAYGLNCLKSGIIAGYTRKADTMYAALFTLPR